MTADQIKEPEPASRAWDNAGAGRPSPNPQAVAMSARHWTPAELDLLIHSYSLREEYPYRNTPSFESIYMRLRELDLITVDLRTTEKGNVLVELLLRTPEPRNVWLDPRDGKEIMAERSHPTLDRMIEVTKSARDWLA